MKSNERDLDEIFDKLKQSAFRRRFRLPSKEMEYLKARGLKVILEHAADFINKRLAPASPANDGKQTPLRNHPVFVAQHATATCCRGCLEKWHGIRKGAALQDDEQQYVLAVLERWLRGQGGRPEDEDQSRTARVE
ncbi:MAG TPA: DUF4186 domain-containing protein [Pyrinomonadaceae bacterium]|jgi:predicted Fe-S protein YdhL (DUF1289 family)